MPKALSRNDAIQLAALVNKIPAPLPSDIAKCKLGAFECRNFKQFCEFMEVDNITFKHWVNTNIEFRKAYRSWREHATEQVEQALAKKAIGFTRKIRKQILTRQGQVVDLIQEEYFPPDTAAAGMWLKNRNGKEWKDTQQIDVNVQTNIRAWLVNAMEDGPQDDNEIINVTPELIEQKANQDVGAIEAIESEAQALEREKADAANVASNIDIETSEQESVRLDAESVAPDIASLNAKWS